MKKSEISAERKQSALRLRQIRENSGFTQEQFAEILGISLSAYKKIESGENQISLASLKKLKEEMSVSADFILYDRDESLDGVWYQILNCSEADKMLLLVRLLTYFTETKQRIFPLKEEQSKHDREILQFIKNIHIDGETE